MKVPKQVNRRSPAATALATTMFRQRRKPSKKLYQRKARTQVRAFDFVAAA